MANEPYKSSYTGAEIDAAVAHQYKVTKLVTKASLGTGSQVDLPNNAKELQINFKLSGSGEINPVRIAMLDDSVNTYHMPVYFSEEKEGIVIFSTILVPLPDFHYQLQFSSAPSFSDDTTVEIRDVWAISY